MAIEIENLTESLQKYLGIQQAQTVAKENIAADTIARLFNQRGNVERLVKLWTDESAEVVARMHDHPQEFSVALAALRDVLDRGFVTRRHNKTGHPSSFLPLAPEMITREKADTVYRQAGMSVLRGLWQEDPTLLERLRARIRPWRDEHPLARLLAPLCAAVPLTEKGRPSSHLTDIAREDPGLAGWINTEVREDWDAWLKASDSLSIDEQLETFIALIGLHLHVALLWRLRVRHMIDGREAPPLFFASASVYEGLPDCERAGRNVFNWWSDRAHVALRQVAANAVERVAQQSPTHDKVFQSADWHLLKSWQIPISGKSRGVRSAWETSLGGAIEQKIEDRVPMHPEAARAVVIDSLVKVFTRGNSSVASKIRTFLRTTGIAGGIVGPDTPNVRKRYLLSDGALEMLARLHGARGDLVRSEHEEPQSVEAFLDDLTHRYGLVITSERESSQRAIEALEREDSLRGLRKRLPSDPAMRENRSEFERRLDELRLLRRYSDASAVVHVPHRG